MQVGPASLIYQSQAAGHSACPGAPMVSNRSAPSTSTCYRPGRSRRRSAKPVRPVQRWRSIMPQLCSWPNGGYNAEHVGPPVVAAAHPPGRLLAESINELDRLIGTWGFISRLPLHLLNSKSAIGTGFDPYRDPTRERGDGTRDLGGQS